MLYAVMKKQELNNKEKVYLLWTRRNKNSYSMHAIYFDDSTGLSFNENGKFYDLDWSMCEKKEDNEKDIESLFISKVVEETKKGYTSKVGTFNQEGR